MRQIGFFCACLFVVAMGCAQSAPSFKIKDRFDGKNDFAADKEKPNFVAKDGPADQPGEKPKVEQPRKIKYTADMRVIVDDFDKATDGLQEAVKQAKGIRAHEEVSSSPGSPRVGVWRIRVPLEHFDEFRTAVARLGAVERNSLQSDDITAQYYDLEAHIKNRQAARETLRELLKETGKKEMKHYLEVWDKLEKVSDEIDRAEGQLRLWANLTDLTTVTVTLHEKQKYIAEEKAADRETPTFGMRVSRTWNESWEALLGFVQWALIVVIALTPWLSGPIALLLVIGLLARRRWCVASAAKKSNRS